MLIRRFWKQCDVCGGDALWVEATEEEAESAVFPRLSPEQIDTSRSLAHSSGHLAKSMGAPGRTFCFLVSKDLSTILPHQVHYPIHQLWNAYSPFESMPEQRIQRLEELSRLTLPATSEERA